MTFLPQVELNRIFVPGLPPFLSIGEIQSLQGRLRPAVLWLGEMATDVRYMSPDSLPDVGDSALPSGYQSMTSAMPSAYQSMTEAPSEFTERTVTDLPSKDTKPELRDFTPKVWDARLDKMSPAYSPADTPSTRQAPMQNARNAGQVYESIEEAREELAYGRRSSRDSWEYDSHESQSPEPLSRSPSMPDDTRAIHNHVQHVRQDVHNDPIFDRASDLASDSGWDRLQSVESQQSYNRDSQRSLGNHWQQRQEQLYRAPPPPSSGEMQRLLTPQSNSPKLHIRVVSVSNLGGKGRIQDTFASAQPIFCRLRLLAGETGGYDAHAMQEFRTGGKEEDGTDTIVWNQHFVLDLKQDESLSSQLECSIWRAAADRSLADSIDSREASSGDRRGVFLGCARRRCSLVPSLLALLASISCRHLFSCNNDGSPAHFIP